MELAEGLDDQAAPLGVKGVGNPKDDVYILELQIDVSKWWNFQPAMLVRLECT